MTHNSSGDVNPYSKYEPLFDHWYIRRQIGKGAIGHVYEIEREDLGVTYKAALKAITIPAGEDDITATLASGVAVEDLDEYYNNLMRKVVREIQFLARLKGNSYVVNYEDHLVVKKEDGFGWDILIKTELLNPLMDYALDNPLTESDVIKLGMDICKALEYCSKYGIIHRDIKPENIFIAPSGDYKLGDFGIARVVEETQMSLSRKGTYSYMSPEVFHGESYGPSADVYSLGLVMYKYLNHSRSPFMPPYPEKIFYDDNEKAFTERMSGKELPPPAQGSDMLKAVVLKACAYDPASRYKSAAEMLEDLEEIQYGRLNKRKRNRAARKASEMQPDKRTRRQKAGFAAAYICLLLATIAATYISVPKEVTDIQGIDSNVSLYYDASLRPQYAIEPKWFEDEKISFKSGDESVFKVSETGKIEAVSIGEADLTMKAREYTETVHVSVVPKVTEIGGVDKNYNLITGSEIRIRPDLEPDKFADEDIDYSSDNEAVATISDSGKIKAVSAGTADITIRAGGASFKSKITVSNPQPVIRYNTSSKSKKKSSGKSKSSSGSSDGYFESGDDENF